ncbi:aldo/keto reductase [Sporichthya sp.]|uniref:aldo/keto reductase n=1 Tax=Sporichthya sp. TaxID=65475 RepID=UPI0017EBFD35|nr:aldo/keto reductase [Sporichthya sp.]MBA3744213.1 aldo/keto reductase [Sporichthya sp.]
MTTIPARPLGTTGLQVGAVGLGCMSMSWAYDPAMKDDETSIAAIRTALETGVTLIDTAPAYGPFHNEELVGRAINGRRPETVLATKVGLIVDPKTFEFIKDGKPASVKASAEDSLQRLGVEHIDLFQLHRVDPEVPIEETWGAMAELVSRGLVGHLGLSEVTVEECARAAAIHPVASVQSEFSLWTRDRLADVIPWCEGNGASFIPFAPLGRGYLTGSLDQGTEFEAKDFRSRNPRFTPEARAANQVIVDEIRAVAEGWGATPAQVAIAWTLAVSPAIVPIPGTRRPARVRENAEAANLVLSDTDRKRLDDLPAPVGARY